MAKRRKRVTVTEDPPEPIYATAEDAFQGETFEEYVLRLDQDDREAAAEHPRRSHDKWAALEAYDPHLGSES